MAKQGGDDARVRGSKAIRLSRIVLVNRTVERIHESVQGGRDICRSCAPADRLYGAIEMAVLFKLAGTTVEDFITIRANALPVTGSWEPAPARLVDGRRQRRQGELGGAADRDRSLAASTPPPASSPPPAASAAPACAPPPSRRGGAAA